VRELATAGNVPVAVLSMAKGDFPEADPAFAGLYAGAASAKRARLAVEDTDLLITVGVTLADTVTGGGTHQLPETRRIDLAPDQARIGSTVYAGVGMRPALRVLTHAVRASSLPARADLAGTGEPGRVRAAAAGPATPLTHEHLWACLQEFLLPGDLVVADQGTAFYGAADLTLPAGATLIGQPLWASIGWSLPAAFGASLAAPDRRAILVIGDGAVQQTAAELGTMLAQGLAPVVIVLSNGGYAIERAIHSPSAAYHHIPAWDWTKVPATLAPGSSPVAVRAATAREFGAALGTASDNAGRPVLIEAMVLAIRNSYTTA